MSIFSVPDVSKLSVTIDLAVQDAYRDSYMFNISEMYYSDYAYLGLTHGMNGMQVYTRNPVTGTRVEWTPYIDTRAMRIKSVVGVDAEVYEQYVYHRVKQSVLDAMPVLRQHIFRDMIFPSQRRWDVIHKEYLFGDPDDDYIKTNVIPRIKEITQQAMLDQWPVEDRCMLVPVNYHDGLLRCGDITFAGLQDTHIFGWKLYAYNYIVGVESQICFGIKNQSVAIVQSKKYQAQMVGDITHNLDLDILHGATPATEHLIMAFYPGM